MGPQDPGDLLQQPEPVADVFEQVRAADPGDSPAADAPQDSVRVADDVDAGVIANIDAHVGGARLTLPTPQVEKSALKVLDQPRFVDDDEVVHAGIPREIAAQG